MKTTYLNIREIRTLKKFSQEYMARRLNIVVSAYSKIERGLTQLTIERLNEISKIFGVSSDYITNYHLPKEKPTLDTEQSMELKNDLLTLLKYQAVAIIRNNYDSIMMKFEETKVSYESLKNNSYALKLYEESGYPINSEEDYENAPEFIMQHTDEQFYQGFIYLMNDYMMYYYFKFGIYPENLDKEWHRYKLEHDDSYRYPMGVVYDSEMMYQLFTSIGNPNSNLFK